MDIIKMVLVCSSRYLAISLLISAYSTKVALAHTVRVMLNDRVVEREYNSCGELLNDFELIDLFCDTNEDVRKVAENNFPDFAYCVSILVNAYPDGGTPYDDFYAIPRFCTTPAVLRASADPRFEGLLAQIWPLYYGYLTSSLIPRKLSDPLALGANPSQLRSCLNRRIKNGIDVRGSIGALGGIYYCLRSSEVEITLEPPHEQLEVRNIDYIYTPQAR